MTNEERDIIARFIARFGVSEPQPGRPPLPPIDPEADGFIKQQLAQYPEALYRVVQSAFVQEAALGQAQQRIQQLQWQVEQAQQAASSQPPARSGFLGGLFGGGQQAPNYQQPIYNPPQPQYAPGVPQPGMMQAGGQGFLGSALTTAAGVAGGMVMGNMLMDMFSGPHAGFGGGLGGGFGGGLGGAPVEETVINNYNNAPGSADPWSGAGGQFADQGNGYWSKDDVYQQTQTPAPSAPDWSDSSPDSSNGADSSNDSTDWSDNSGGNDDWS